MIRSGKIGENAAVPYIKRKGYKVIERNFVNKIGEIDLIALDGDTLCFIEVKARDNDQFGSPFESVTLSKQKQIVRVAQSYLLYKNLHDTDVRFDVIAVYLDDDHVTEIESIENAFEAS